MTVARNIGQLSDAITEAFAQSVKGQRWEPRQDGPTLTTYCNEATNYVCCKMGYFGFDKPNSPHPGDAIMANEMVKLMSNSADWKDVEGPEAQDYANKGALVVAGWANESGHGHVCVVRPGCGEWSASWQAFAPKVLNVGKDVFIEKKASFAFRTVPRFFVLRGML